MRVDSIIRRVSCLAVAGAIATGFGGAAAAEGLYAGVGGGLFLPQNSDVTGRQSANFSTTLDATAKPGRGHAFTGAVGYRFADGLRVEGELSYRKMDLKTLNVKEPGGLAVLLPAAVQALDRNSPQYQGALDQLRGTSELDGDVREVALMANLYYDFDLGLDFSPYVVGGIGLNRISVKASGVRQFVDDDDTVMAYQFGGGLGYRIGGTDDRPVTISLDFRHFVNSEATFIGKLTGTPFDAKIGHGNYVGIGLRFGL